MKIVTKTKYIFWYCCHNRIFPISNISIIIEKSRPSLSVTEVARTIFTVEIFFFLTSKIFWIYFLYVKSYPLLKKSHPRYVVIKHSQFYQTIYVFLFSKRRPPPGKFKRGKGLTAHKSFAAQIANTCQVGNFFTKKKGEIVSFLFLIELKQHIYNKYAEW